MVAGGSSCSTLLTVLLLSSTATYLLAYLTHNPNILLSSASFESVGCDPVASSKDQAFRLGLLNARGRNVDAILHVAFHYSGNFEPGFRFCLGKSTVTASGDQCSLYILRFASTSASFGPRLASAYAPFFVPPLLTLIFSPHNLVPSRDSSFETILRSSSSRRSSVPRTTVGALDRIGY